MPSFGEKLKREREKRAISLEQIALSTKIGTRMLQALEEERFNQLPGGIFNKGFVRAYARCLGIDEDQAVADYLEASGEGVPAKPEPLAEEPVPRIIETREEKPSRPLPWGLFAALLLLVALGLSVWSHRQQKPQAQPIRQAPSPAPAQIAAPPQPTTAASPAPTTGASSGTAQATPATVRSGENPSPGVRPSAPEKTPITASSAATAAAALPAGGFTVEVQVREESWIAITADGKTVVASTLSPGSQRSVRGYKEVIVRAGNAGGVDFFFNGKRLSAQGDFGEAKTVTFGPAGVQTATATPPSTQ